jgi:hypothetical protein
VLEYKVWADKVQYRWANCIKGFNMPLQLTGTAETWLHPGTEWKEETLPAGADIKQYNPNFYITVKKMP